MVKSSWLKAGIPYSASELPKSQIYLETPPLFTRGLVRLPDHPTLLRELRLLERQTHRGGRDSVDHPRGGHDDFCNSLCGSLRLLSDQHGFSLQEMLGDGDPTAFGNDAQLTDAQRAERRKEQADSWYQQRLLGYIASYGGFGFGPPFGRI
jgi:hypothetical protein